jgi:hypothetical protein
MRILQQVATPHPQVHPHVSTDDVHLNGKVGDVVAARGRLEKRIDSSCMFTNVP